MADMIKDFANFENVIKGFGVGKGDILYVASDIKTDVQGKSLIRRCL